MSPVDDESNEELVARNINFDDYLHEDDNLCTTEEESLDQIIAGHQTPDMEEKEDDSDDDEENTSAPPPSQLAAFNAFSVLMNYFTSFSNVLQNKFSFK